MKAKLQFGNETHIKLVRLAEIVYNGKREVCEETHQCDCEYCEIEESETRCPCGGDIETPTDSSGNHLWGSEYSICSKCKSRVYSDYLLKLFTQLAKECGIEVDWKKLRENQVTPRHEN